MRSMEGTDKGCGPASGQKTLLCVIIIMGKEVLLKIGSAISLLAVSTPRASW